MPLVTKRELRQLMQIHYVFEILLALAYVILKSIPWIAIRLFGTSEFRPVSNSISRFFYLMIFHIVLIIRN